jgi:hypothetical protein
VTLDADDLLLPELELAVGVEAEDADPLVPAPEALPEAVTWPAISAKQAWTMNTILP